MEAPSHAYRREVLRTVDPMEAASHAWCGWIEGGAAVTGGEAVWDVSVFRYLPQWYPAFEVSIDGQEMMVQAASTMSMRAPVETQDL